MPYTLSPGGGCATLKILLPCAWSTYTILLQILTPDLIASKFCRKEAISILIMGREKGFDEFYHTGRGGRMYHIFPKSFNFFFFKVNIFSKKLSELSIIIQY